MKRKTKHGSIVAIILAIFMLTSQTAFAEENVVVDNGELYETNALSEPVSLYDPTLGMSDEQVLDLYEQYLKSKGENPNQINLTEKDLKDFADYAVEEGIINDTQVQKAAVTKAVVRASLSMAAEDANLLLGYTTASACLKHSLQDSPVNVSITSTDSISTQVKNSSACKKIISEFKSYVKGKNLSARTTSGSTALNSSHDLTLAFNKVSYVASGTKNSKGIWTLKITFNDTYDFDCDKWTNTKGLRAATINALNSYGAYAESIGAVVPYKIKIAVKTTFSE